MGQMIDGVWHAGWYEPDARGEFQRPKTRFRNHVSAADATPGRYHLYVSYACPWAHRTLITRAWRGLQHAIDVSVVEPKMGDDGWQFSSAMPDTLLGTKFLRDVYLRADARYTGRVTVPVLWDKQKGTIVNNESREVMRMLDESFDAHARGRGTLVPAHLRTCIDEVLDAIYAPVNNGVYRAGFATTQQAYEEACRALFDALDHWNAVLSRQRYLCGDVLTEADVALFTTLIRFDLVYYAHFKCNIRRIADYPGLNRFLREIYDEPEIRQTVHLDQIKTHYYWSQTTVNPHRLVPIGPHLEL